MDRNQLEFEFCEPMYQDLITKSIETIQEFEPEDGYYLAFSGGKDSVVLLNLAQRAGVKYEAHYNVTTVDPPELVQFVKQCEDVIFDKPHTNMWRLILQNGTPPTRLQRYCCRELKECYGEGRRVLTGIRAEESHRRAEKRKVIELCGKYGKQTINPIFRWREVDIWRYIRENKLSYCSLYDEGFKRIGCVLCPLNTASRKSHLKRFPGIVKAYMVTFTKLIKQRKDRGQKCTWDTAEELMNWWLSDNKGKHQVNDELSFLKNERRNPNETLSCNPV